MYRKALAVADTARHDPPEADYNTGLAVINERLGAMFMVNRRLSACSGQHRESLADEQAMRAAEPDNAGYSRLMANGYFHLSDAFREERNYEEALKVGNQALALYEDLARADPRNVGAKKDVGGCIHKLAEALLASGDGRAAERRLERAITIRRELAAQDTGSIEYRDDLADTLMLSGESLLASHQPLAAIERLDEARRIREPIVASRPQQVVYTRGLAQLYSDLGDAFVGAARRPNPRADDWRDAEHWYQRALVLWQDLGRRHALWTSESTRPADVSRQIELCTRALHALS